MKHPIPESLKIVFRECEAAIYLGLSRATLRRGRMEGARAGRCETPPFIRMGRAIRYLQADLDLWLQSHRVDMQKIKERT